MASKLPAKKDHCFSAVCQLSHIYLKPYYQSSRIEKKRVIPSGFIFQVNKSLEIRRPFTLQSTSLVLPEQPSLQPCHQ